MVALWVSVAVFLAGHLGVAIWFGSRVAEQLRRVLSDVDSLARDVKLLAHHDVRLEHLEARVFDLERVWRGGS